MPAVQGWCATLIMTAESRRALRCQPVPPRRYVILPDVIARPLTTRHWRCDTLTELRDLRLLRVFAVLRDGCGWRGPGMRGMLRRRCWMRWLRRWRRTGGWRRRRVSFARRTRGCGRRTRGCLSVMRSGSPSLTGCGLTWRFCSGCCSGGRRSSRVRSRPPAMMRRAAGSGRTAPAGAGRRSAARGRGRGGGMTRTCPGSRWSGIPRVAGTAARIAGSRSRCRGTMSPSSWTGW